MNPSMNPNAPPDVSRLDLYTAAFLTGGPARVADVAVLAMRATGVLHIGRDGTVTATGREPADPVTAGVLRAVQAAGGTAPLAVVRHQGARSPEIQGIGHQLFFWGLMRWPGTTRTTPGIKVPLIVFGILFALLLALGATVHFLFFMAFPFLIMGFVIFLVVFLGTRVGRLAARRGHTQQGMYYVVQLRRDPALRSRLDGTVAGGFGLGEIAVMGLARLTDYALLDVFRQQRVAAVDSPHYTAPTTGSLSCAAAYNPATPSWCGSASCADSGFRGTSCAGSSSGSWSCSLVGGGSSCGGGGGGGSSCGGGGSSCGGSSGGSSCGGGGGGSSCGGGGGGS
ncbi:TIGR04222 domain-containing membrane protein [Streptomycetaceae bacterium NBC_01309]